MRRLLGVLLFLLGLGLFIWGLAFKQRPLYIPVLSEREGSLWVTEPTLNELLAQEALTQTPTGELTLTAAVAQRLPTQGQAQKTDVEKAAESTKGSCST